jgi:hypothetical protein
MMPTQEQIDKALIKAEACLWRSSPEVTLAAAYHAEKERADSLEKERDIFQKSAGMAMRQYAELAAGTWKQRYVLCARHEYERKALCQST